MSSLRRVQSSKANGALSKGPSTPAGKQRSALNAMRHGLCAKIMVVEEESSDNFLILLQQHIDRFRPDNEVEFGMIEEMCAAYWRQRRAWAIETGMFNKQMAIQPGEGLMDRMAAAFETFAASHALSLLQRYETRQHLMYQRSLRTLIMLRTIERPDEDMPNDPSPISGHSDMAPGDTPRSDFKTRQPTDSEPLSEPVGNAGFDSSKPAPQASRRPPGAANAASRPAGQAPAAHPAAPQPGKESEIPI